RAVAVLTPRRSTERTFSHGSRTRRVPASPRPGEELLAAHGQVLPRGPDPGGRILPPAPRGHDAPAGPADHPPPARLPCLAARAGVREEHHRPPARRGALLVPLPVPP